MAKLAVIGPETTDWAARAQLMGWDVAVLDCDPEDALEAMRGWLPALYDVALPAEGRIVRADDIAVAVSGADLVILAPATREAAHDVQRKMSPGTPLLVAGAAELRAGAPEPRWMVGLEGVPGVLPRVRVDVELSEFQHVSAILALLGVDCCQYSNNGQDWLAMGDVGAAVSVLRALKARKSGIGAFLAAHEASFAPQAPLDLSAPPVTVARQVPPDWVDYNGHMNEARYLTAFSDATDRLLLWAGMDAACVAEGHSVFTVETHIRHLGEVDIGNFIELRTRVLDGGGKRLHLWHEMSCGDTLAATAEQLLLHVDLTTRRVGQPRADIGAWLEAAQIAQAGLPAPDGLGRSVGAPR